MERWTFIRRIISRFRPYLQERDFQGNDNLANPPSESDLWSNRFCIKDFQPKSLPAVDYDEILSGQVEDFSPDCWLDGHIHRFAAAAELVINQQSPFSSQEDLSSDSSSFGSRDSRSRSASSSPRICESPRNILLDLFAPMYESAPPPYSDEPPPSYEEAMSSFLADSNNEEEEDLDWMWY